MADNPEAAVISAVCENKDIDALMREKVLDMFTTHKDVALSTVAFYHKYGSVPTVDVLQDRFREFDPVDIASPTEYYVDRLRESFLRSRITDALVAAGQSISNEPPAKLLSMLSQEVSELTRYSTAIKDLNLTDHASALRHYEAVRDRVDSNDGAVGILSGIKSIDSSVPTGFAPGHLIIMLGYSGRGKAEWVNTVIPTPDGPKRFGDLQVGSKVYGSNGLSTIVVGVHPQGRIQSYKVSFSDGTSGEFSGEHLWHTIDEHDAKRVMTTNQVKSQLVAGEKVRIPLAFPIIGDAIQKYPGTFPYFLGTVVASDGQSRSLTYRGETKLKTEYLQELLYGHNNQRASLLSGVMDVLGTQNEDGEVVISGLLDEYKPYILDLSRSLGDFAYERGADIVIRTVRQPFKVPAKANTYRYMSWEQSKEIIAVTRSERRTMMCISVAATDSLYLTKDYTVTHNTWLSGFFAVQAFKQRKRPMIISMEMTAAAMRDRLYATMGNGTFHMSDFQTGAINSDDFASWATTNVDGRQDFIVVSPDGLADITPDTVQAKINQYKPDIVVIDYMQLMSDGTGGRSETEKVKNISKALKQIATRNSIPVIAISAVTSPDLSAPDGPPMLEQVAWSRSIQYDADLAIAVHKHDDSDVLEVVSRKNRHGPDFAAFLTVDFATGSIAESFSL